MTIGIAAHGPNAGLAVVRALAAVEAIGRGAIGGFVSLVAIGVDGRIERAVIQRGGSATLFGAAGHVPSSIATSRVVGLMSSGPDRPEPLSQFTPADAAVGLVTGHRMPNTIGASGMNLNDEVLELMRRGLPPDEAAARVAAANPTVDAGIIALSADGRLGAANTAHVARRGDAGRVVVGDGERTAGVAVLHNAIHPHRPLAVLAAEVAMDVMQPEDRADGWILFSAGVRLVPGPVNSVDVHTEGRVQRIIVDNTQFMDGRWSLGIGYETPVRRREERVAVVLYEPYMVVDDGRLCSIDGQTSLSVPIRSRRTPKPQRLPG